MDNVRPISVELEPQIINKLLTRLGADLGNYKPLINPASMETINSFINPASGSKYLFTNFLQLIPPTFLHSICS